MLHRLIGRASAAVAFGFSAVLSMTSAGLASEAADRASQHLANGEFAAAAAIAQTLAPAEKAELTAKIDAARKDARPYRMSAPSTEAPAAKQPSLKGTGADFQSLIQLIQDQTKGPWRDVSGNPDDGTMSPFESGVRVDAKGVLTRVERMDMTGAVAGIAAMARKADLNDDVAKTSELRMVSLTRLEREVADRIARGERLPESMKQLAGLSEVRYVFVDQATKDVIVAGPAEGWDYNASGAPVGHTTGRPTLRLDDLVTVMRTFEAQGQQMFGCSIDPRAEGLKAVKEFVETSQAKGPLAAGQSTQFAKQIGDTLGRQDISVYGVPADSRVARVIVEADYRMKLIGVGKLEGGKNIPSYFDLLAKQPSLATGGLDALRWWMTLNTEAVLFDDSRTAFEIRGASVRCLSENQFITSKGERASTGKAEPINRQFAEQFTKNYSELAASQPIFADLEGVFDLAMAAALIQHEGLDRLVNWNRGSFASKGAYRNNRYAAPKEVDTVVSHRVFNGKDVVVQVAGGVRADVLAAVTGPEVRQQSNEPAVAAAKAKAGEQPASRWWWDAVR